MTIKKIDEILDISLWIVFALCIALSWIIAKIITAPDYELADSDFSEQYIYETEDGERITSNFYLAWDHKNSYIHPDLVVYDPTNCKVEFFKPEYLEKYKSMASESKYIGLWHHLFWVWFIGLSLIFGILIGIYGPDLRDVILVRILRGRRNQFLELSYFLFNTSRLQSARREVQSMIPAAAKQYVIQQRRSLSCRFSEKFYNVLIGWLNVISRTGSTTIPYTYQFENKLIQMQQYLTNLINYWDTQRGINPDADSIISYYRALKSKDFVEIPLITKQDGYEKSVTAQLNRMFVDIMGSEIFTFQADSYFLSAFHAIRSGERVVVKTILYNDASKTFKWSGSHHAEEAFPGIRVFFTVDIIKGTQVTNLWQGDLEPVCNYTSTDEDFSEADLYNNMVIHTIDTFVSTMKNNNQK